MGFIGRHKHISVEEIKNEIIGRNSAVVLSSKSRALTGNYWQRLEMTGNCHNWVINITNVTVMPTILSKLWLKELY